MPDDWIVPTVADRELAVAEVSAREQGVAHFVPAEEGYLELPVIDLDPRLLVYRVDNGRILSELDDAASRRNTTPASLRSRAESPEVQKLLHELLLQKARDPAGPIYEELERFGRQTEPLLIHPDGVVLNGNRRLAAIRDLRLRDPQRYEEFKSVRAAVLPRGLRADQIEFIEAALQMSPSLRLEYGWVNRRLKLRQHTEDMGRDRVVQAYRFTSAAEIDDQLGELAMAEAYLEWIGQPWHYVLLEDWEEQFASLHEQVRKLPAGPLRDIWELLGFAMIKAAPALDEEITHYFPFTDPVPGAIRTWVPRTMAADFGVTGRQDLGENRPLDRPTAGRLRPLIDDHRRAESTAGAVISLINTLKNNEQKLVGASRVLDHLRKADRALNAIGVDELSVAQLRDIRALVAALRERIGTADAGVSATSSTSHASRRVRSAVRRGWRAAKRWMRS